jgi:DNA-binding NtrC family response regulator
MSKPKILIVDDDKYICDALKLDLKDDYEVTTVNSGQAALGKVQQEGFNLVLLDVRMPGMGGIETLKKLREVDEGLVVVMHSAYDDLDQVVESISFGAYDYVLKSPSTELLRAKIKKAIEFNTREEYIDYLLRKAEQEYQQAKQEYRFENIIAVSPKMKEVLGFIEKVADSDASVLLLGETGVGKTMIARAIHGKSGRRGEFIDVSTASLPETLIESELFGHERGAFTGAIRQHIGYFERAEDGTIVLDEIGELALDSQKKLLEVLRERTFYRLEGTHKIKTNARVIAATNKDLQQAVEDGKFREDLYYRLKVFPITVPPLRERKEDIEPLVRHFLRKEKKKVEASKDFIEALLNYDWPGNVSELENIIRRVSILSQSRLLTLKDVPKDIVDANVKLKMMDEIASLSVQEAETSSTSTIDEIIAETINGIVRGLDDGKKDRNFFDNLVERIETDIIAALEQKNISLSPYHLGNHGTQMLWKKLIRTTLERYQQNKVKTAEVLGLSRPTLYKRGELSKEDSNPIRGE